MTSIDEIRPSIRKLSIEGFGNDRPGFEKKIGHRRVDDEGLVTYKKRPTSELMAAIQLGISQSVGGLASKQSRDVLYEDFHVVETISFPRDGSNITPAHRCSDFKFRTYAPVAFRYFRDLFKIKPDDYLLSLCNEPLMELSNPGASGSIFYLSQNDEFIIKTVQYKEADFLKKLLPGYYMNLNQNPCTFLPKFYGLYCYQCGGKNIRFVIMNNILPSQIAFTNKFDLKGSTYKRKASKHEKAKPIPTLKDLDFIELYPDGLILDQDIYQKLIKTISRDCRVLESFKIMDYSFLIGIQKFQNNKMIKKDFDSHDINRLKDPRPSECGNKGYMALDNLDGILATNHEGDQLMLYVGIIDILQSYRFSKKFEHAFKSVIHDGNSVSVHNPKFYANRFETFFSQIVFRVNKQKKPGAIGKKSIVLALTDQNHALYTKHRPDVLPLQSPLLLSPESGRKINNGLKSKEDIATHKLMMSSHLNVVDKSTTSIFSTPTYTQNTDATFSYTASSPSATSLAFHDERIILSSNDIRSPNDDFKSLNIDDDSSKFYKSLPAINLLEEITRL